MLENSTTLYALYNIHPAQTRNQGKVVVRVDVDVWAVLAISEVDELFSVKFKLTMTWRDPRLTFRNLKDDTSLNQVNLSEALNIWHPILVFVNTRKLDLSMESIFENFEIIVTKRA